MYQNQPFNHSPNIDTALRHEIEGLPDIEWENMVEAVCQSCGTDFISLCSYPATGRTYYQVSDSGCAKFIVAIILYVKYNKNLREIGIIMSSEKGRRKESSITYYINRGNILFSSDERLQGRVNVYRAVYNRAVKRICEG